MFYCFIQISRLEQTWVTLRQRHTEGAILYEKKLKPFMKNLNDGKGWWSYIFSVRRRLHKPRHHLEPALRSLRCSHVGSHNKTTPAFDCFSDSPIYHLYPIESYFEFILQ